ncbi:hypothetical protein MANES_16G059250v8 [Manihot esculenta]|uniref:Uncharacterized protein n=1 Tax=Manihot esculenta TaxID=3983 RepID=A0ACB7G7M6_MANES|nr:hypothetical protein MANES_16G059250v8 [Manihot esculenta]
MMKEMNINELQRDKEQLTYHPICSLHKLKVANPCKYCGAKRLNSKVKCITTKIPNDLLDLFTSINNEAKEFRKNVQLYNDEDLSPRDGNPCYFQLHFCNDNNELSDTQLSQNKVGAIWIKENHSNVQLERKIIIQTHSRHKHKVKYYFGCYDPLHYPLLNPKGKS